MSKRVAGNQLTHDNWDDEEEAEEAGVFKRASVDTMKQRKIKTAKRRGVSFQSEGEGGGAFSGFKGFSGFGTNNGGSSGLSGFSALKSKPTSSVSNGTTTAAASSTSKIPDFKFEPNKPPTTDTTKQTDSSNTNSDKSKYFTQLKGLNENVAAWIKKHVDSNPYCILTPIFKDYEKHLAGIEKLNRDVSTPVTAPKVEQKLDSDVTSSGGFKSASISSSTTEGVPVFKFAVTSSDKEAKEIAATSSSDHTKKEPESSTSGFTFAASSTTFSKSSSSSTSSGFQFGTSSTSGGLKPFSFAMGSTSAASNNAPSSQGASGDDDEYVPPKPEVKEIKEDAIYSKRCKLFFQKETADGVKEWVEKGIGNLHLKETEGGKTQLLIRADTNLGNVLLNILLSDSIPLSRQGKNNVNMMCIPSPPVDPKTDTSKPIMMLIRVKTSDDADELYEKMTELKKGK
ncbi:nuclear pore complex protein Nup50-like isoform X2 [Lineus longissimus]|uniref:nuclear pore complex protein Nup50-like isoform X2 n=1 Tax=Lineus longissimus TaxID=88925 RepID=UPI00315C73C9